MTSARKCALAALLVVIAVALLMVSGIDDRADRVRQLEPTAVVASE
jgi:hypothetical protein